MMHVYVRVSLEEGTLHALGDQLVKVGQTLQKPKHDDAPITIGTAQKLVVRGEELARWEGEEEVVEAEIIDEEGQDM